MSKELEALKRLYKHSNYGFGKHSPDEDYELVETALKAIEVIKEKLNFNFDDYAKAMVIKRKDPFPRILLMFDEQEKYDLLKEALKND